MTMSASDRMNLTAEAWNALSRASLTRRTFLRGTGALIVGFSASGLPGAAPALQQGPEGPRATSDRLDSWIAIGADGVVTAYTGKCELGQGLETAQIQLIAEEVGIPVSRVRLIQCDTAVTPDQGTTSGSQSHPANFNTRNLAQACATAREAPIQLA